MLYTSAATGGSLTSVSGEAYYGGPPLGPPPVWIIEGAGRYMDLGSPPVGMSRVGDRVVERDGTLWIDGAPPSLVHTIEVPMGISADGSSVFGQTQGAPLQAVWTAKLGVQHYPQGGTLRASSADGKWYVGTRGTAVAVMRMPPGVSFSLRLDGDGVGEGLAVTPDGSKVIGISGARLFSWMTPDDKSPLPLARPMALDDFQAGFWASGLFVSDDGSVVAGTVIAAGGSAAFVWTGTSGLKAIPRSSNRPESLAFALSADGSVVLGVDTNAPTNPSILVAQDGLPFTWSATRGSEALPVPAGVVGFETVSMTRDASLIFGNVTPNSGMPPVVWDDKRSPRPLFADAPLFLKRCHPVVTHVSADGKTFAGACGTSGRNTGFVARSP
jgi:hypothetical protein